MTFFFNYLVNWYYAFMVNAGHSAETQTSCTFGLMTSKGLTDLLRALIFVVSLAWYTRKTYALFPLPFTWIFRDLSKFIFDPTCVSLFRKYLQEKEPKSCEHLDQIMRIYLRSFNQSQKASKRNLSSIFSQNDDDGKYANGTWLGNESKTATKRIFEEYIIRLQPCFDRFKETNSYKAL